MRDQFKEEPELKGQDSGELEFILLPEQIPRFWDSIKYACERASGFDKKVMPAFLNKTLTNLLSGSSVCGIVLTKERKLESIVILHIDKDDVTDERAMFIDAVYSFISNDQDGWLKKGARLIEYAKRQDCKKIKGNTGNKKLHDIIQSFGVKEIYRCYSLDI